MTTGRVTVIPRENETERQKVETAKKRNNYRDEQDTFKDKQTNSDKVKIKKKIKRWGKANRRKETDRQHRQVKRRDADAEEGRKKGK